MTLKESSELAKRILTPNSRPLTEAEKQRNREVMSGLSVIFKHQMPTKKGSQKEATTHNGQGEISHKE